MGKIRIYELAKEVGVSSKELVEKLKEKGLEVKPLSSVEDKDATEIRSFYKKGNDKEIKEVQGNEKKKTEVKADQINVKKVEQKPSNKPVSAKSNANNNGSDKQESTKKEQMNKSQENVKVNSTAANTDASNKGAISTPSAASKPVRTANNQATMSKGNNKFKNKKNKKNNKNNKQKNREDIDIRQEEKSVGDDEIGIIEIGATIIVKEFADLLNISAAQVISKLIGLGVMVNQNQSIDFDIAAAIGEQFGVIVDLAKDIEPEAEETVEEFYALDFEDEEADLKPRAPIVTVMGHVDHGKTSLLDAIKKTHVTKSEAGGITQHIGAYSVNVGNKKVCFLDTPGHEAFTSMRARGAQVTDIAILVVAADDGVMPQTIEAINHAKAAKVPIIVAINKIDKDGANIDKIRQELMEHGLVPEDWGGDVITVPVSAKNLTGIDELLEMVLLVAEMQELRANPNRNMVATVVEAQLDKGKGSMATILLQKGSVKVGDYVVSGSAYGRIRAMFDDKGKQTKKVGPSTPVVILGLSEVPNAGDLIYSTDDEKTAKIVATKNKIQDRADSIKSDQKISLDDLFDRIKMGEIKDLNIIIKADVRGSIEAIKQSLSKLGTDEVKTNLIHGGVGGITETDVMLASASNAIIVGFNVRPNSNALEIAKREKVDIRTYRVIYEAIEDIQAAIKGMHAPKYVEEVIGRAEVRQTFRLPTGSTIAGIHVKNGKLTRNSKVRIIRDDVVIFEGDISSLKRFKDDVKEVASGYEAGIGVENYNDIKEQDVIEAYINKEVEMD